MEELETKKYAGIDLGRTSVQFSIYREGQEEMTEESFPLSEEEQKEYIESGMRQVERYMEEGFGGLIFRRFIFRWRMHRRRIGVSSNRQ